MQKFLWSFLFLFLTIAGGSNAAIADDCTYKDDFGITETKSGCIGNTIVQQLNPVNQVPAILGIVAAVGTGDVSKIKASVGNALITSPMCLGCTVVANTIVPNMSRSDLNLAIGTGFFVFLDIFGPTLVTVDQTTNTATQQTIVANNSLPQFPLQGEPRKTNVLSARAECIVQYGDGSIYAGWKNPAAFSDRTGTKVFPNVSLVRGDIVSLTAPLCGQWNMPSKGQRSVTAATVVFDAVSSLSGDPSVVKWFIYGKISAKKKS